MRRIQPAAPDADTFRRAQERASLAPEWLPPETLPDLSDIEPPTHLPLGTFLPDPEDANAVAGELEASFEAPLYLDDPPAPPRPHFARSRSPIDLEPPSVHVSMHAPRGHVERSVSRSVSAPTPVRPRRAPAPVPVPVPAPAAAAAAAAAAAVAAPAPPSEPARPSVPQLPGGIDPLLIATPPELASSIYGWVRRLALQADLAGADRLLRDALADLTSSLTVQIVYPGADDLFSLGGDEEVPKDPTPIIMVAQARRAMIASHTAILPIVTSAEAVGVIMLTRNPRNPGYTPVEQVSMLCLAREAGSIIHNLAVEHLQKASEVKADKGSLYRGEALEAHRARGQEGMAIELSPGWVRRTYPLLVIGIVVALIFAIFIHVPTYSSGRGVIAFEGSREVAPFGGNVEKVFVDAGSLIKKGMPLVRLVSTEETTAYEQALKEYDTASYRYIDDPNDLQSRAALATSLNQREGARKRLEARTIRAKRDGLVSDIRLHPGSQLNPGDFVALIIDPEATPVVFAFLPGTDRPRLHAGQTLQIEVPGFNKTRERAVLIGVSPEVVSGNDAGKYIGAEIAEPLKLDGSFALAKAHLPSRTFKVRGELLYFHHGMAVTCEVKVLDKPFLVTLLPALEKYLPD